MVRFALVAVGSVLIAGAVVGPGRASLYQPADPNVVPVRDDGTAEPFPPDEFRRRMGALGNAADPRPTPAGELNPDRAKVLARVRAKTPARGLSADDTAALAADLIRLGNSDRVGTTDGGFFVNDALNLLAPRVRDRVPSYFVHTTLAQAHAARGEWAEAATYHDAALLDAEMPAAVKGWTPTQRDWVARLDRTYVPHYLHAHKADADARPRPAPEAEEPTPLFPAGTPGAAPVRFADESGAYRPGELAAAERAKLPPDAVAVVQQLLLWFPSDTRLYWLLAELYAAGGDAETAQKIMDECAWSRQYGNRNQLMDHRAAVADAVEAKRKAAAQAQIDAYPINLRLVFVYFGVVAAVAAVAVARALGRRRGGGCGPGGCC